MIFYRAVVPVNESRKRLFTAVVMPLLTQRYILLRMNRVGVISSM